MIAALLAGTLVLLVGIQLRLPHPFVKHRTPDPAAWDAFAAPDRRAAVQAALASICHAFLVGTRHADRLRPDDRLADIYRAAYPTPGLGDSLEFEHLHLDLTRERGVPEAALATLGDMTAGDVVALCLRNASDDRRG